MTTKKQLVRWIVSTKDRPWHESPLDLPTVPSTLPALDLEITGERRQHWEGCGGCFNELGWTALAHLDDGRRQQVLRELFHPSEGCRFTLCRLPIGASDYAQSWYSLNEAEGDYPMEHFSIARDRRHLIPYIQAARTWQPGLRLFASPWSPPTWMKQPQACNYGILRWDRQTLEAYALYLALFVEAYATEGLPIEQIHVQNEPDSDQKFPSCVWTGERMRDFIRDYLGPTFKARGLSSEIWAGTIERGDYHAWAGTILADPQARMFIAGVGYQWAGQGAVQRTRAAWPGVRILQTENECGDGSNSWEYAHYVFGLMQHYITNGVNGYTYWNMVLEPEGRSTWGWRQNAMITVDPASRQAMYNPEFYVMKHLAHFVEPGAVCLAVRGNGCPYAVAFENSDGQQLILAHNPSREGRRLSINHAQLEIDLPPRSFHTLVIE